VGLLAALGAVGLGLLAAWWWPAQAQTDGWTAPKLIFEGRGVINAPTLVADQYGQVHAFWVFQQDQQTNSPQQQIYYTRLDQPTWPVNDIFSGPVGVPTLKASAWQDGLAILWSGSKLAMSNFAPKASAQAWSSRGSIDSAYSEAGMATALDGALWVIYGTTSSNEIVVQRLNPVTKAWEAPRLVSDVVNAGTAPDGTRLSISADGTLHAVWAEYLLPNGWPPIGLYYAQSTDGGLTWTDRHKITGPNFNQPNVVAGPGKNVYVTWTGTAGAGQKYFQESLDGGHTWQNQVTVMSQPGGGSEGAPNLAVDSAGNIHMVFSHNGCVWHTSRQNNVWSAPECISIGVPVNSQIEFPTMAIGLGNQIHVLFWTDRHQIWYTSRALPVAGQQPLATPTLTIPTATAIVPTATAVPSQTPIPDFGPPVQPETATQPGVWALLSGVIPVVALFAFILVQRSTRRK
jgi:hypothetical protein